MSDERASCASLLTPTGRGAVAVIAAEGAGATAAIDAAFRAANGRSAAAQPLDRIAFGEWGAGEHREEVIVIRSGDAAFEIHCHGGVAAAQRILAALESAGCVIQSQADWAKQRSASLIESEADAVLAQATTRRTAEMLLNQRNGALQQAVAAIRELLNAGQLDAACDQLSRLLERAPLGRHLIEPWLVAIAGRPNVGKSSLINAIVGYQRAIVFDQPGTTRDVLTAETAIDGWPVRLADAAGIRETNDPLEAEGVARARQQLQRADLVLWVLDGATLADSPQIAAAREWREELGVAEIDRVLIVVNKADRVDARRRAAGGVEFCYTSALTGDGLPALLSAIAKRLVPSPPQREAIPFTVRQVELLHSALNAANHSHTDEAQALLAQLAL
ncbi:GTPase [Lacipirellula parvula]|uniref:MnmE n=1 Tax=Lacipirellula parvula TaxID=2650471 RepID=A0A5K7XIW6_9BACT|nr:GTPase [Lacipirellula parvula]BBO36365.1 mnmE [Lacipirellula parvula]